MLDIKVIRQNSEKVKTAVKNRGLDSKVVDRVLKVDEAHRQLAKEVEKWRGIKNKLGKEDIAEGKRVKEMLRRLEPDLKAVAEELKLVLAQIPNIPAKDVPVGRDESDNVEIKKWGKVKKTSFKPKDHLDLGEALDVIDVKRTVKVSGSRFGSLKNEAALLELALLNFGMKLLVKKGFTPIIPPAVNKKEIEWGLGYSEGGGWDQMYLFEKDGINFVSSSEHTIIPQHSQETLAEKDLPLRYVGYSSCFRREAGTYGKDTRGIFRNHQFEKLEMNVITVPNVEVSDKECLRLLSLQEEIIQALKLPYRVLSCCTGDLPFPNRRLYDLDVWFPGQGRYREVQSCSNCTDYQTRRLGIKAKTKEGTFNAHALNATAIAMGRTIAAILENYQQKDGSVLVPEVLQKYTGFKKITPKKK